MHEADAEFDVAIVGAGVAGALIADQLAREGVRVALLEAGPDVTPDARMEMVGRYARVANRTPNSPYADVVAQRQAPVPLVTDGADEGHYLQRTPQTPLKSTYQRLVGGSTWHWLGNTPRFVPNDFRLRSVYGIADNWPLDYDDLEPWYGVAEQELGVAGDDAQWRDFAGAYRSSDFPMPPVWPAYGDHAVKAVIDGMQTGGAAIQVRSTPQARNSIPYQGRPPCAGNSSCVPICPIAAKYDAEIHVRKAQANGARLFPRCVVRRLDAAEDGRVRHLVYERWDRDGSRESGRLTAGRFILAAHAIETPLLLQESGLAPDSPVGQCLMDHLQGYGLAVLPKPVYPFRGPPVTSGIDAFRDGAWRRERAAYRMSLGNDGWGREESPDKTVSDLIGTGLWGRDLRQAVSHRITRMIRISYSTEMPPDTKNQVTVAGHDRQGNPRPAIRFSLPDYNVAAFEHAKAVMADIFAALGATETRYSHPGKNYSGAGHIMGTCRMGADPAHSVTDSDCRVHGHANLFIAGASLFTTCGTANPTLTAAALALRLGDFLVTTGETAA